MAKFQSTPPARGATARTPAGSPRRLDFNPRPPRGGRPFCSISLTLSAHFNPRPPRGGRLSEILEEPYSLCDFNPRPPRGGRLGKRLGVIAAGEFQSTPPARGATEWLCISASQAKFQSTPPARGATESANVPVPVPAEFQSTPPARGATSPEAAREVCDALFQSTPPARGATASEDEHSAGGDISIHAPREGGDSPARAGVRLSLRNFNPRPPRGGRLDCQLHCTGCQNFNPRPPRGGRPSGTPAPTSPVANFNPRPPRGGRQQRCTVLPADL